MPKIVENMNIEVAAGSSRCISVRLVTAAGAPVTDPVVVELALKAPLTGELSIILATASEGGVYNVALPSDLVSPMHPGTGESIPWHYSLLAGEKGDPCLRAFLSGELQVLPAALASELASDIAVVAVYNSDKGAADYAVIPSAVAALPGVSEQQLVDMGVLDVWEKSIIGPRLDFGSIGGAGTQEPSWIDVSGGVFEFAYKMPVNKEINRLRLDVKADDVPSVWLNGAAGVFNGVITNGDGYVVIEYAFDKIVVSGECRVKINNAQALGGGLYNYNTACPLATGTVDGIYPYAGVYLQEVEKKIGIEAEIYLARAFDSSGHLSLYKNGVEANTSLVGYFKANGGVVSYEYGSVELQASAQGLVGFTAVVSGDKKADLIEVLKEWANVYEEINGEKLLVYKLR